MTNQGPMPASDPVPTPASAPVTGSFSVAPFGSFEATPFMGGFHTSGTSVAPSVPMVDVPVPVSPPVAAPAKATAPARPRQSRKSRQVTQTAPVPARLPSQTLPQPPKPQPKKKPGGMGIVGWVIGAFIILGSLGEGAGALVDRASEWFDDAFSGNGTSVTGPSTSPGETDEPYDYEGGSARAGLEPLPAGTPTVPLGHAAVVGDFVVQATGVSTTNHLESEDGQTAIDSTGTFVVVAVDIRNDGSTPIDVGMTDFKLYANSRAYYSDITAGARVAYRDGANTDGPLEPGETRHGVVIWDVPIAGDGTDWLVLSARNPVDGTYRPALIDVSDTGSTSGDTQSAG